tara:strand:- start:4315 stop:4557 length:243 start_codon:yes stop_codon:yes gene_type:complete
MMTPSPLSVNYARAILHSPTEAKYIYRNEALHGSTYSHRMAFRLMLSNWSNTSRKMADRADIEAISEESTTITTQEVKSW